MQSVGGAARRSDCCSRARPSKRPPRSCGDDMSRVGRACDSEEDRGSGRPNGLPEGCPTPGLVDEDWSQRFEEVLSALRLLRPRNARITSLHPRDEPDVRRQHTRREGRLPSRFEASAGKPKPVPVVSSHHAPPVTACIAHKPGYTRSALKDDLWIERLAGLGSFINP